MKAFCPAFIVVTDNVLTNPRPLLEILGRIGSILLIVLYGSPKPVKDLGTRLKNTGQIFIGAFKAVGLRQSFVGVKALENTVYIYSVFSAIASIKGIMFVKTLFYFFLFF